MKRFKLSNDPRFIEKLRDVVGLYVAPASPCRDPVGRREEPDQALDRTQPGLPMKPGRAGTMTHDYKRHGTTTLFAALNILDGTVIGRNMQRHPSSGVHQLPQHRRRPGIAIKGDPRHRRQLRHPQPSKVRKWLARHRRWTFHFTPTSAS